MSFILDNDHDGRLLLDDLADYREESEHVSARASRAACGIPSIGTPPPGITPFERRWYFRTPAELAADNAYDLLITHYNTECDTYFLALDKFKDAQNDQPQSHLRRPVRPVWPRRGQTA